MKHPDKKAVYYDINCFTIREMTECVRNLRTISEGAGSMEEVADRIVRHLYEGLIDGETGERASVLVRLFKTHPYIRLDPELQAFARNMLSDKSFSPEMKCMVLLATAGEEAQWNSRRASQGHKAVPLPSEEAVNRIPMFLTLIKQFGMNVDMIIKPDLKFLIDLEQRAYNVYHVPEPLGNPYIPAQKDFIIPYRIRSILGFGGLLPSGDMFAVPLFFKVPVSRETAELFRPLSISVKLAIVPYENAVFSDADVSPSPDSAGTERMRNPSARKRSQLLSQAASLEQLLEVYEKTVVEQSDKLYEEITERKAAERELGKYRIHLEELVKVRTEELLNANERLKSYSEDLERSNRELEQFAYTASHDLKSPILTLASDLKLLERRNRDKVDDESRELIREALASAARMQNFITDLLSYAKVGASELEKKMERISLAETIEIVRGSLKAECERVGCTIAAGKMPDITANPTQMVQLFQNILSNAIKFRGAGQPQVEIRASRGDRGWLFSVKDNGIGIPPEHKDKIFEIFHRVPGKQGFRGTGVGLAICKKIVEQHHGRIWVESKPGEGATFYFTIPDQKHT